jgi:hypothetical protein
MIAMIVAMMIMRRRRLMDEMGSRYNFFCGPVYLILIDKTRNLAS